jgi:hypothetical protein
MKAAGPAAYGLQKHVSRSAQEAQTRSVNRQ